jgi:hypothetical protein
MSKTSPNTPSPLRALLWKEWHESAWLLALTVSGPGVCYWVLARLQMDVLPPTFCLIGFAWLLGARLFASERARGTGRFLAERPAERVAVWDGKMILPTSALILGILVAHTIDWYLCGIIMDMERARIICAILGVFGCAILCSACLDSTITAISATLALIFALLLLEETVLSLIFGWGKDPSRYFHILPWLLLPNGLVLGWLSRVVYGRTHS